MSIHIFFFFKKEDRDHFSQSKYPPLKIFERFTPDVALHGKCSVICLLGRLILTSYTSQLEKESVLKLLKGFNKSLAGFDNSVF